MTKDLFAGIAAVALFPAWGAALATKWVFNVLLALVCDLGNLARHKCTGTPRRRYFEITGY